MLRKSIFFLVFASLVFGIVGLSQDSFADFSFSEEFGTQGSNDNQFNQPTDIEVSNDGTKLYVVDSQNNRIKIYELTDGSSCPSGTTEVVDDEVCLDDSFGSSGSASGRFNIPTGLTIDKNSEDIYVIDSDNNRIQRFQDNGVFDGLEFGSSNSSDKEYLEGPIAIAMHKSSDYIYVADKEQDSIVVFDDRGVYQFTFDDDGSGDDFRNPSGLVIDDDGDRLYVADTGDDRIRIFELTDGSSCPSGTTEVVDDEVCFVDDFGESVSADREFDRPSGLVFDEDNNLL